MLYVALGSDSALCYKAEFFLAVFLDVTLARSTVCMVTGAHAVR